MDVVQRIAERFIRQYSLTFEEARKLANAWAERQGKQTTAPFYGNANDWESIELLRGEMESFCVSQSLTDKAALLTSGDVVTITCTWPISDIATYLMYKALARVVWHMIEKNQ